MWSHLLHYVHQASAFARPARQLVQCWGQLGLAEPRHAPVGRLQVPIYAVGCLLTGRASRVPAHKLSQRGAPLQACCSCSACPQGWRDGIPDNASPWRCHVAARACLGCLVIASSGWQEPSRGPAEIWHEPGDLVGVQQRSGTDLHRGQLLLLGHRLARGSLPCHRLCM